jgi:prepilin-type N-terminal cleavage/methylation domain-containing protein
MRWLSNQRGFTLAELLVAASVLGLLMAGVFVLQRGGQEAYLLGSNRVETQQNARVALDLMTRELRTAAPGTAPQTASISTLASCTSTNGVPSCTDIAFIDEYGQAVRYWLAGTTLNRTVNGTTTALIGGAQSLQITCYKASGQAVGACSGATACEAARINVIKIGLVTKTEETVATHMPGDQHATMESTIKLRATLS